MLLWKLTVFFFHQSSKLWWDFLVIYFVHRLPHLYLYIDFISLSAIFSSFVTSNKSSAIKGHSNGFFFKWLVMILNRWYKVNIRWKPSGFHSPQPEKQLLGNLKKKLPTIAKMLKKINWVNRNVQRKTYGIFLKNPFV